MVSKKILNLTTINAAAVSAHLDLWLETTDDQPGTPLTRRINFEELQKLIGVGFGKNDGDRPGSTYLVDWSDKADIHYARLTGNNVISFTNPLVTDRGYLTLVLKQDPTGGRTVTWVPTFASGGIPYINPTANESTVITIYWDGAAYHNVTAAGMPLHNIVKIAPATGAKLFYEDIEKAFDDLSDGDILVVPPGTYTFSTVDPGFPATVQRVVHDDLIIVAPYGQAVFQRDTALNTVNHFFHLLGERNTFVNIRFDFNATSVSNQTSGNGVCFNMGSDGSTTRDNEFFNCEFVNAWNDGGEPSGGNVANGVTMTGNRPDPDFNSHGNLFHACLFADNGYAGIRAGGSYNRLISCRGRDNAGPSVTYNGNGDLLTITDFYTHSESYGSGSGINIDPGENNRLEKLIMRDVTIDVPNLVNPSGQPLKIEEVRYSDIDGLRIYAPNQRNDVPVFRLQNSTSFLSCRNSEFSGTVFITGLENRVTVSIDSPTDTITTIGTDFRFRNGDRVWITTTGTIPAPLVGVDGTTNGTASKTGAWYYIANAVKNDPLPSTFQLSTDALGSDIVDLTSEGSGNITVEWAAEEIRFTNCSFNSTLMLERADQLMLDDGTVFTDATDQWRDDVADDIAILPTVPVQEDAVYFGDKTLRFDNIWINVTQAGAGSWTLTWEYWNGSTWTTIAVTDPTVKFTIPGINQITFTMPTADWAKTTVNTVNAYWIRARVSAFTSVTTPPLVGQGRAMKIVTIGLTNTNFPMAHAVFDECRFALNGSSSHPGVKTVNNPLDQLHFSNCAFECYRNISGQAVYACSTISYSGSLFWGDDNRLIAKGATSMRGSSDNQKRYLFAVGADGKTYRESAANDEPTGGPPPSTTTITWNVGDVWINEDAEAEEFKVWMVTAGKEPNEPSTWASGLSPTWTPISERAVTGDSSLGATPTVDWSDGRYVHTGLMDANITTLTFTNPDQATASLEWILIPVGSNRTIDWSNIPMKGPEPYIHPNSNTPTVIRLAWDLSFYYVIGSTWGPARIDDGNQAGAVLTLDLTYNHWRKFILTGNITSLSFTNPTIPTELIFEIHQDGTGGWTIDWSGLGILGGDPVISTTINGVTIVKFYWDGANYHS